MKKLKFPQMFVVGTGHFLEAENQSEGCVPHEHIQEKNVTNQKEKKKLNCELSFKNKNHNAKIEACQ